MLDLQKQNEPMKIVTSYFGQLKNLANEGITPISISQYPPSYYFGIQFKKLAPTHEMMKMSMAMYDFKFKELLSKLNPHKIVKELEVISGGKDIALICFEKLQNECHRGDVAKWLNDAGYDVQEFEKKEVVKVDPQGSLF